MLKPINKKSLSDAVFEQLRDSIVTGELPPGDDLPSERALCQMLEVNRGALREAIKRLEQARLVMTRHGGATTVLDYKRTAGMDLLGSLLLRQDGTMNLEVARAIVELRKALGPEIARLAAQRIDDEGIAELRRLVEEMRSCPDDLERQQALGLDFWQTLVDATGNLAYQLAYNTLRETYEKIRAALAGIMEAELRDIAATERITVEVAARSPQRAHDAARSMLEKSTNLFVAMIKSVEAE